MNTFNVVETKITALEIVDFPIPMPLKIIERFILNGKGIRFEDDGKPSSVINENPVPLGTLKSWHDKAAETTFYKQHTRC